MPVAGVVLQNMHYLAGFQRLGYDVYYVEDHACSPSMFQETEEDDGSAKAAKFIAGVMERLDLEDRWAYHALHGNGACYGLGDSQLRELYSSADLIINLHGGTMPLPEHYATGRLVFLETDPVELQLELYEKVQQAIDYLEPHCAFFTFAENYGKPDCRLPLSDRFRFLPTRQPVVFDFWDHLGEPRGVSPRVTTSAPDTWTTIGNWRQNNRDVRFQGETYFWSKHHEFLKFLDLPAGPARSLNWPSADTNRRISSFLTATVGKCVTPSTSRWTSARTRVTFKVPAESSPSPRTRTFVCAPDGSATGAPPIWHRAAP